MAIRPLLVAGGTIAIVPYNERTESQYSIKT